MGKKEIIVYTSGTFDLFHVGHLNILKQSRAIGDKLIVGVSTDELVATYKKSKPIVPYESRAEIIRNQIGVDLVVKQEELTPVSILKQYDVDIVTIGSDWENKCLEGLEWMKHQKGKKVVYLQYTESVSTTKIKKMIIDGWQEDRKGYFER